VKVLRAVVGLDEEVLLSEYQREKLVNLVAGMINSSLRLHDGEIEMTGEAEKKLLQCFMRLNKTSGTS